jgi:hypothetical protein
MEFRRSLKNPWAEELVDLFFFRPAAFICVKLFLYPLPITPNQVSFLAMAAGILSGAFFLHGDKRSFILGAVFYGIANILDCCDGMIARLKKNGTLTGRIVDGCIDYIIGIAVYAGFAVGLEKAVHAYGLPLPLNTWLLMVIAGISIIAHSITSDKIRNSFVAQTQQPDSRPENEVKKFQGELIRLEQNRGHIFDKILIKIYLRYLQLQSGRPVCAKRQRRASQEPGIVSSVMVVLWNFIGPSTHVFFLILSVCFYNPMIFFIYVIGIANLWMFTLLLIPRLFFSKI